MTAFLRWLLRLPPARIVVVRAKQLPQLELTARLAVADTNPVLEAVRQLIDTAEENAERQSAANIGVSTEKVVGYTAGAEHLRMLRDELAARQAAGLLALTRVSPDARK
jgi:hypothetical protein